VTDIIGTGTAAKIHKMTIPQGVALPYIRLEVFEGEVEHHLLGISGMARNVVQVDCYQTTSDLAFTLAEAVRLVLENQSGTLGSLVFHEILSTGAYREDEDRPSAGSQTRRFYCSRDYNCVFKEPTS
jgi:hypothetical protein